MDIWKCFLCEQIINTSNDYATFQLENFETVKAIVSDTVDKHLVVACYNAEGTYKSSTGFCHDCKNMYSLFPEVLYEKLSNHLHREAKGGLFHD